MSRLLQNYPNRITMEFGEQTLDGVNFFFHDGIDIVGEAGWTYGALDYILCHTSGRVIESCYDENGKGCYITIDCGNGISMQYCHLADNSWNVDEYIEQGDIVGYMGQSGNCTGSHLHFGICDNGEWVNPESFLDCEYVPRGTSEQTPTEQTANCVAELDSLIHQIALDVIAGAYGNGEERKNNLGKYYRIIQDEVNNILS